MGVPALTVGVPVMAMGHAIYDMPELTFQGGLDDFWCNGTAPNAALFDAFRRVLVAQTQVNGGFYSDTGLRLAVEGAVTRLEAALTSYAVSPPAYDEIPANMSWAVKSGHEEENHA
jgi:capsular polysaccharide export protein